MLVIARLLLSYAKERSGRFNDGVPQKHIIIVSPCTCRKEVNALRGGSGNEAKNERLRVRWLGSAVTELQSEVAEVLRTRNASEELAERSRMRSELALLKGDVAEVGRSIRDLGGRLTKLEATLGTIRFDIAATKERTSLLSRSCADVSSQVSCLLFAAVKESD